MKTRRPRLTAIKMGSGGGSLLVDQDREGIASGRLQPETPKGGHGGVRQGIRPTVRRGAGAPGVEGLTRRFKNDAGKSPGKSPGAGCRAASAGPLLLTTEVTQPG